MYKFMYVCICICICIYKSCNRMSLNAASNSVLRDVTISGNSDLTTVNGSLFVTSYGGARNIFMSNIYNLSCFSYLSSPGYAQVYLNDNTRPIAKGSSTSYCTTRTPINDPACVN